ncbi:MAG: rubrerythrin family protein [Clostridia bacterium]|nr:rubrerythrin family protein [Clostridia bacterium]
MQKTKTKTSDLLGTKTEQNLWAAFANETQTWMKYTFFADKAKTDGFSQIADVFTKTADNEKEHAEIWFKLLKDGAIPDTLTNLNDAAGGENYEWTDFYRVFADEAREDGFDDIAALFDGVAAVEKSHENRFRGLIADVEQGKVFRKDTEVEWICGKCGHTQRGAAAPETCPVCGSPKGEFRDEG